MKYLIEVPDGTVYGYDENKKILIFPEKNFIEASEVSNLIYLPNVIPYEESIDNKFYNTAWMDGYEKGVEAGRDDAWEFVTKCLKVDGNDFYEIFNSCDALCITNLSYQEAKVKYDAWKKKKDEIRVGDEVFFTGDSDKEKSIVLRLYQPKQYKPLADIWWHDGEIETRVTVEKLVRTGRHFDEVEELVKKMRKSDED